MAKLLCKNMGFTGLTCDVGSSPTIRATGRRQADGQETVIRIKTLGGVTMGSNPSNAGSARPLRPIMAAEGSRA